MVTVSAHGGPWGMANNKNGTYITGPKGLDQMLKKNSDAWKNRKGNEGMTIVLYSCRTGADKKDQEGKPIKVSFAQRVSASKEFKDVEIIAPDQRVYHSEDGPVGSYKAEYAGEDDEYKEDAKNDNPSDEPGNWNVFKNGELIRSYKGTWTPTDQPSLIDQLFYEN